MRQQADSERHMNQVLALLRFFREQEWIQHATHADVLVLVDDALLL